MSFIKPILKWVGGKTQILTELINHIPKEINNYHEPFIGGGSVLLAILTLQKKGELVINNIYAYDLNKELITMYKTIQLYPNELFDELNKMIVEFNTLKEPTKKKASITATPRKNIGNLINDENKLTNKEYYYYWIRQKYNTIILSTSEADDLLLSALFIFLNKTCFRGVYRTSTNGFNVPYGNYINPEIINREHLLEVSELIQNVHFIHSNFEESFLNIKERDFVYIDPPYVPERNTSFVGYNKSGFSLEQHKKLFILCGGAVSLEELKEPILEELKEPILEELEEPRLEELKEPILEELKEPRLEELKEPRLEELKEPRLEEPNIKILISNSDTELVKSYFKHAQFTIIPILCKRSINSKDPTMKAKELIIKNY